MKRLLFSLLFLLAVTIASAQDEPANYDGGSALRAAILKAKNKKTTTKTKTAKHKVVVTEIKPPAHTKEEATYLMVRGEESSSYLHKLIASEYWKKQQESAALAQSNAKKLYDEQAPQRKADSIANAQAQEEKNKSRRESLIKVQHRADSIRAMRQREHDAYIERMKIEQKKNR